MKVTPPPQRSWRCAGRNQPPVMKNGCWVSFQSVLCSLNLSLSCKSVPKCGSKTPSWHFHSIAKTGQMEERLHEWTQTTVPPAQLQFNELGQCSTCWNNQRKRSVKHLGLSDWVNTPICDFLTGEMILKTLSNKPLVSADPQLCADSSDVSYTDILLAVTS